MGKLLISLLSFYLILTAISASASPRLITHLAVSDEVEAAFRNAPSSPSSFLASPTTFFEVQRPIPVPGENPCSTLVLQHDFAYTYGKPPVTAAYSPPSHCFLRRRAPSRIVLEWSAACAGRQFDRIFGVWLAGVELLRSCTAEPRSTGIVWNVRKDVTRYASLFSQPQTLAVYLGNLVDQTYTGIYHVNVSFHFYFDHRQKSPPSSVPAFGSPADMILPISKPLPLNDGLWFQIDNSTDFQGKELAIPRNAYRAALEVYISFHSDDEFWYTNPPNSYISANNLTDVAGNGAFREVTVRLDGNVIGAIWPFTVIYTGGINPLLWRPISGIGSFDLPSYDLEMSPFLEKILDGKMHSFEFGVTDALHVWFIDANLHLWLDRKSPFTEASLIEYKAPAVSSSLISQFKDLDGHFDTNANRKFSASGWVNSSYGNITTHFYQELDFSNRLKFAGNGSIQAVNQSIIYNHGIESMLPSAILYSEEVLQSFPLSLYTRTSDHGSGSYSLISNVTLGFNERKHSGGASGFFFSRLRNLQTGEGVIKVKKNLVTSGLGSTQQIYIYESSEGCYFRNVSSSHYTILYDESEESCSKSSSFRSSEEPSFRWFDA
ncbi:Peptide-N4-(N-acetyl-beta-glucosaminyl)asparagine amidase A [Apostasia shenzhenica]|uniref:Peptide-N4-(N-acetyl-beta-glucosaminyl)asparagine amidase A n=1 Tax=Apostasia shenzhenica TaxID=1088818 RepID=A0A2I0A804_9ASPA|nr:Peptide-N4-(N-acetyl-beta-glucosaminyl)asparagine amidase A [Apostasia shenzhenica]